MKIIYIANVRLPTEKAHGLQIMKTCEAFARASVEIELVVPTRHNEFTANPFTYYGVPQNSFKLVTLRVPDLIRYGRLGFLVSSIWFSERARWSKSFWTADMIYSRDALVLVQYLLLGRKLVFEAHAKPSFVARIVARHAYRVVVISNALREVFVAAGIPKERIVVAPDAVDEYLFDTVPVKNEVREMLKLPLLQHIVVYTGHLYVRKGADTLAEAATRIPDTLFVFVGGTIEDIARFKKRWGSQENIRIVGHVAPERVPLHLRAADVLVIPNSGKSEDTARFASPMKLFEYMASGVPIIASNLPSIREILDDSLAYFFTPDDHESLCSTIGKVLGEYEEAKKKGASARAAAEKYSWQKRVQSILDFIKVQL
ncbi:MAG: glycosyltransferase family 4 protein [Minisyncoccota bacterium]